VRAIRERLRVPKADRIFHVADALRLGMPLEEIYGLTGIDPWFLANIRQIVEAENQLCRVEGGRTPLLRLLE